MLAHWCLSQNFGDRLTHWLVHKITGSYPKWVSTDNQEYPHLVGAGSILNQATANSVVWGAGLASMTDGVQDTTIRMVRGPLSAWRAAESGCKVPKLYGDPALLCPTFHSPKSKKHKQGLVMHYADEAYTQVPVGVQPISMLTEPVESVIDAITECETIISSSLHGLVVADAYGIPAAWIASPRVRGGGFKFYDHILATGGSWGSPLFWSEIDGRVKIPQRVVKFDAEAMLNAFPTTLV